MNKNQHIFIFSKSIGSGKTTQLQEWINNKANIEGFLTPDIDGMRMFFDIKKQLMQPFQVQVNYQGAVVSIGRFRFSKSAFEMAKHILANASAKAAWLIIDEVGKLEIEQGEGFEPEVLRTVKRFQSQEMKGNLLLVIRDTLLEMAMEKYDLTGCKVFKNHMEE